jgi:hypothetical protein
LAKDAALLAGGIFVDLLIWLAPVVVLGGIGLALLASGTEEQTGPLGTTTTSISSIGWLGAAFVCAAVATFFGRGTIRGLYMVARGTNSVGAIASVRDNLVGLAIAALAVCAGLLCLAFAAGIVAGP